MPETNVFTPEQSERVMKIIMGVDTHETKPSQRRALDALKDICDEVIDAGEQEVTMPKTNMRCEACHEYERAFLTAIRTGVDLRDENESLRARIAELGRRAALHQRLENTCREELSGLSRSWIAVQRELEAIDAAREDKPDG